MTRLCFTEIHEEPLFGISFDLGPGLHLVLGQENDGNARLIELAAGLVKPRQGRIEIEHQQPYYSPELRARIGSLLPAPQLPAARSVTAYVSQILRLKAAPLEPLALLAEWQLEALGRRSTLSLDNDEARSLGLALALETPNPTLLCLYQPFDAALPRKLVLERIRDAVENGSTVLVATSQADLAELLPANVLILNQGRLLRTARTETAGELAPGLMPNLVVVSSDTRALAGILSHDPRITSMTWDGATAPTVLRLWATDLGAVSQAVVEAALQAGVEVSYLGSEPLSLLSLQTAAYYDALSNSDRNAVAAPTAAT